MASISSVGAIQAEIATRLNEVSATEADVYLGWINQTTLDIVDQYPYARWLEASADHTLSGGTRLYSFPMTDFQTMYSVTDPTNQHKLTFVTKQEFDALQPSASMPGTPTRYTIWNEQIEFYPTPDNAYTIHYSYSKNPSDVSAASAVPPLPYRWMEAYVFAGVARGLERRGDYQTADMFWKKYQDMVEKVKQNLKSIEMKRIKSVREFRPNATSDPIKNAIWQGGGQ